MLDEAGGWTYLISNVSPLEIGRRGDKEWEEVLPSLLGEAAGFSS